MYSAQMGCLQVNDNQIVAIIIAMINSRYFIPGKDNEKTAKEIVKVYYVLKDKTYDEYEQEDSGEQFTGKML